MLYPVCLFVAFVVAGQAANSNHATEKQEFQIAGPVSFSLDGSIAAVVHAQIIRDWGVGGSDPRLDFAGELHLLDTRDWKPLKLQQPLGEVSTGMTLLWSADGKRLLAMRGHSLFFWEKTNNTWNPLFQDDLANRSIQAYATDFKWSRDGKSLLAWDAKTKRCFVAGERKLSQKAVAQIANMRCNSYEGFDWTHDDRAIWVAVCDNYADETLGRYTAAHEADGIYLVPLDGRSATRLSKLGQIRRMVRSPDAKYLVCEVGGMRSDCLYFPAKIALVSTENGVELDMGRAHPNMSLSWSADSKRIAFNSTNGPAVYNLEKRRIETLPRCSESLWNVVLNPTTGEPYANAERSIHALKNGKWSSVWSLPDIAVSAKTQP